MYSGREEAINVKSIGHSGSEVSGRKVLIVEVDANPFATAESIALSCRDYSQKREDAKDSKVDLITMSSNLRRPAWRQILRVLPHYNSVRFVYCGFGAFMRRVLPLVLLARFYGKETSLFFYPGESLNRNLGLLKRWALSLFDSVYVASRYLQRMLGRQGIRSEIRMPTTSSDFVTSRPLSSLQPNILAVQSDVDSTSDWVLIRAFGLVKQKYPRAELTVFSNRRNHASIMALAGQFCQNGINCFDSREAATLRACFSEADLYVNCSSSESLPVALVTAMVGGLPVISFDTAGPREVVEHGTNGLLVRHNDFHHLADSILELIEAPELVSRISANARKSVGGSQ